MACLKAPRQIFTSAAIPLLFPQPSMPQCGSLPYAKLVVTVWQIDGSRGKTHAGTGRPRGPLSPSLASRSMGMRMRETCRYQWGGGTIIRPSSFVKAGHRTSAKGQLRTSQLPIKFRPLCARIGHSPGAVTYFRRWLVPRRRIVDRQECAAQIVPRWSPASGRQIESGILVEEAHSDAALIHVSLDPDERLSMLIVGSINASM